MKKEIIIPGYLPLQKMRVLTEAVGGGLETLVPELHHIKLKTAMEKIFKEQFKKQKLSTIW